MIGFIGFNCLGGRSLSKGTVSLFSKGNRGRMVLKCPWWLINGEFGYGDQINQGRLR